LVNFYLNKSWQQALDCGVPKRKSFVVNKSIHESEAKYELKQDTISNESQSEQ